jgi:hypothetical protein
MIVARMVSGFGLVPTTCELSQGASFNDSCSIGYSAIIPTVNRRTEAILINQLAQRLAEIGFHENGPVLLYAEAGPAWVGGSIFVSYADRIEWMSIREDDPLDIAIQLWEAAPNDKKWRGVTMVIDGDSFRTEFDYGENWSPDEDEGDRREPIVRAYFGDKPIYYPPLEGAEPWPED